MYMLILADDICDLAVDEVIRQGTKMSFEVVVDADQESGRVYEQACFGSRLSEGDLCLEEALQFDETEEIGFFLHALEVDIDFDCAGFLQCAIYSSLVIFPGERP